MLGLAERRVRAEAKYFRLPAEQGISLVQGLHIYFRVLGRAMTAGERAMRNLMVLNVRG